MVTKALPMPYLIPLMILKKDRKIKYIIVEHLILFLTLKGDN